MSQRFAGLIVIIGLLLFSVFGYIALQQYIDRSRLYKTDHTPATHSNSRFEAYKDLDLVDLSEFDTYKHKHSDGIPVDYLVRLRHWPELKPDYHPYLYKQGCDVNAHPSETCISQSFVVIDWSRKEAKDIGTMDDLMAVLAPVASAEDALYLAMFMTSKDYANYFGLNFYNLTPVPADDPTTEDKSGFHLPQDKWLRLDLPSPTVREDEHGDFIIERAGFIPYGEKEIIKVQEKVSRDGHYTYDIAAVLHRGSFIPIQVKEF